MLTGLYTLLISRLRCRKGQTLVEYGLILALVAIVVISILTLMGNQLRNVFNKITSSLGGVAS